MRLYERKHGMLENSKQSHLVSFYREGQGCGGGGGDAVEGGQCDKELLSFGVSALLFLSSPLYYCKEYLQYFHKQKIL